MLIADLEYVDRVPRNRRIIGGTVHSSRYSKIWECKQIPDLGFAAYKAVYEAIATGAEKARTSGYHRGYIRRVGNSIEVSSSASSRSES